LREPFASIAFGDVCARGELNAGHRPGPVQCLVETKAHADPHQRHAHRSAEIRNDLSQELLKFLEAIRHESVKEEL